MPHSSSSPAPEQYRRTLATRRQALQTLEVADSRLSTARVVVFLGILAGGVAGLEFDAWGWWASCITAIAAFAGLMVAHERNARRRKRAAGRVAYYERALRRVADDWHHEGVADRSYAPEGHPYADDLDLFGPSSLFQLICETRTGSGRARLAAWLCAPASLDVIEARQRGIEELREDIVLREDLAAVEHAVERPIDVAALETWSRRPIASAARSTLTRVVAWGLPAIAVACAAAWQLGATSAWPLLGILGLEALLLRSLRPVLHEIRQELERTSTDVAILGNMIACVEGKSFQQPILRGLSQRLRVDGRKASVEVHRLKRRVEWFEAYNSSWFSLLAFPLLWPLHTLFALEDWRDNAGSALPRWIDALAELEALSSLAAYAFENPDDPFAELTAEGPCFVAEDIGHPLVARSKCVRNSVHLDTSQQALLISGSNMSGKSTFLRSVGINAVLAQAGAPVRARRLRLSRLRIGATVRIEDSLQAGRSRFYAEIVRLKTIVDLATDSEEGHLLFLLDEVFHGTNSRDRRISAAALLRLLVDKKALGLVTTHDLELTKVAAELAPRVANVHFCDELRGDKLHFDYKLRSGVVQRSNARALMRAVGLSLHDTEESDPQDALAARSPPSTARDPKKGRPTTTARCRNDGASC
ncbi:MAG: hypothetical protein V3V08_10170 [Nannocystaceae bacterium]